MASKLEAGDTIRIGRTYDWRVVSASRNLIIVCKSHDSTSKETLDRRDVDAWIREGIARVIN